MSGPETATIPDWLTAAANIASAFGVIVGFWLANRQLKNWRHENYGRRQAEVAEELLAAAYEVSMSLKYIRAAARELVIHDGETRDQAEQRDMAARFDSSVKYFDRLRTAQIRAQAVLDDDVLDKAADEFFQVRWQIKFAYQELKDMQSQRLSSPEHQELIRKYRFEVFGTYIEKHDPLGMRQIAALETIRKAARPYIQLGLVKVKR